MERSKSSENPFESLQVQEWAGEREKGRPNRQDQAHYASYLAGMVKVKVACKICIF
jgi:hypothetical protein